MGKGQSKRTAEFAFEPEQRRRFIRGDGKYLSILFSVRSAAHDRVVYNLMHNEGVDVEVVGVEVRLTLRRGALTLLCATPVFDRPPLKVVPADDRIDLCLGRNP